MTEHQAQHADHPIIIVGFGLPGRSIAEMLDQRAVAYCVVESNPHAARQCAASAKRIVCGDATEPSVLEEAGIRSASLLAITVPHDAIVLEIVAAARALNPHIPIIARCSYTSTGMKARRAGAGEVIVAEQVVAEEFSRRLAARLEAGD